MKSNSKEVIRAFRIDRKLWEQFQAACKKQDLSASQVLRRHIRNYCNSDIDQDK